MPQPTPITKQSHADKSWTRYTSYEFASKNSLAPLVGAELTRAATAFPMAFVKEQNSFSLVAVLSLTPGTNLFVAPTGQWLGAYVPSVFRGYPFRLAKAEGKDDLILCVEEDSGLVNNDKTAGEPFFDDTGEVSQPVKDVLNFLNQVERNRAATNLAVSALADAGVITEWPLKVQMDGREKPVTGLHMVDETKLNSLEDEPFLKLRKAGSLPIAYAQMLSMGNVQVFETLGKAHEKMAVKSPDLKAVFGDDDIISFQ
jgi:hypothetical protein